jgi:ATP-dependent DNA helicase RecQ
MLNEFYKQKIQQVHIVANMPINGKRLQFTLQYVQDYFQMDYKSLSQNTSKKKE